MNEATVPTFTRHYKYTNKVDEGGFLTKYAKPNLKEIKVVDSQFEERS
jgi:hypothetical protein